jgi:hypothetical protein
MSRDPQTITAPVPRITAMDPTSEVQPPRRAITSACPSCGLVATRETYDIGDGPELSCANCEWCWGADGQPLTEDPFREDTR